MFTSRSNCLHLAVAALCYPQLAQFFAYSVLGLRAKLLPASFACRIVDERSVRQLAVPPDGSAFWAQAPFFATPQEARDSVGKPWQFAPAVDS